MLPSRGLRRSRQALSLHQHLVSSVTKPSSQRNPRLFSTALRSTSSPTSRISTNGLISGSRIGSTAARNALLLSPVLSQRVRYASNQPLTGASSASSPSVSANATGSVQPELSSTGVDAFGFPDGQSLLDMQEGIGYLHSLGLDFGWGPTSMMQWALEHIHIGLGVSWIGSIVILSVLTRIAIFKPSVDAQQTSHKMVELRKDPKYAAAVAEMQALAFRGNTPDVRQKLLEGRRYISAMNKQSGIQTWRTFVPLVNLPIAFGMFRLLRNMTDLPVPALMDGGILWFTDLSIPDPLYIMPFASAGIMYGIMKMTMKTAPPEQAAMMKMLQYIVTPISILATYNMTAGVQFYFVISAILHLIQTTVFFNPMFRRLLGLDPLAKRNLPITHTDVYTKPRWQAPRTVNTTAKTVPTPAPTADEPAANDPLPVNTNNPLTNLKNTFKGVKGKATGMMDGRREDHNYAKAQAHEKQRALEEQQKYYERQEMKAARKRGKL